MSARIYTPTTDGSCAVCGRPQGEHSRSAWGAVCMPVSVTAQNLTADNTTSTHRSITLPRWLCEAIESYIETDWKDGRDPSGFGAMNAVGYIGERVSAIYASEFINTAVRK